MKKIYIIYKYDGKFDTKDFATDEDAAAAGAADTTVSTIIAQRGSNVVYERKVADEQ